MSWWNRLFGTQRFKRSAAQQTCGQERSATRWSDTGSVAVADTLDDASAPPAESDDRPWWEPVADGPTELPQMQRPELSAEARALESLLVSHFDGHDLTLPPLLHATETLLPKLRHDDCDLAEIARGLAEDQVIAAAVLRMANSPLYRGMNKITSLRPAVTRLGTRALRTLLMHESLRAATFFQKRGDNQRAKTIWRRSLSSACVMRGLAAFSTMDPDEAFLAGLLHDIGNVVVLRIASGADSLHRYDVDAGTFEYLCQECHQEFGELVAKSWRLPHNLTALIADHHGHPATDDPLRSLRLHIQLTDMINALLGYTPYVPSDLLRSGPATTLGLSERADFVAYLKGLPDEVASTVSVL